MSVSRSVTTTHYAKKMPSYNHSIAILPEDTINKISAGEAIERPAAAAKELIENSIDSGASEVSINIENCGKKLIRVCDNGSGIEKSELPKVFMRHATSKIGCYDDLFSLASFGFRGEALSSLSAVSEVSVCSSAEKSAAWKIVSFYGEVSDVSPSPIKKGTIVEVKNLFRNTPARLKFLRSDTTEKKLIIKTVQAIAMANNKVAFDLTIDGHDVLSYGAGEIKERIKDILKNDLFCTLKAFRYSCDDFSIMGYVSDSHTGKFMKSREFQYIFVNSRAVENRKFSHAFYEAARESLPRGEHPAIVFFLTINPSMVDVNVHPTKREVKLSNENIVYSAIVSTLKSIYYEAAPTTYFINRQSVEADSELKENIFVKYDVASHEQNSLLRAVNENQKVRYICEFLGRYLLAADENSLYLIDAHAAEERVLYEKYKKQPRETKTQLLIEPVLLNLPPEQTSVLSEKLELFNNLGWKMSVFGAATLRCDGVPAIFSHIEPYLIISELITAVEKDGVLDADILIKKACHSAVRGKERLNYIEAQKLITELLSTDNYKTCPHGRPTVLVITKEELAQKFRRSL